MAACFGVGFWIEGGVITAVIILNVAISTSQELEAKTRMNNLRSFSLPTASVIRSGRTTRIPIEELVPGDIVNLKSGDTVPADVRYLPSEWHPSQFLSDLLIHSQLDKGNKF